MVIADDLLIDKNKPKPGIFPDEAEYINTNDQTVEENNSESKTSGESCKNGETSTSGESKQPTSSSLDNTTNSTQSSLELLPPDRPPKPTGLRVSPKSIEKDTNQDEQAVQEVERKLRAMKPLPDLPSTESSLSPIRQSDPYDECEGLDYSSLYCEGPDSGSFMNQIYAEPQRPQRSKETQKMKKSGSNKKSVFNKLSQIVKNSSPRKSPTGNVHDKTSESPMMKRFVPPSKTDSTAQCVEDFSVSSSTTVSDVQDISSDNTDHGFDISFLEDTQKLLNHSGPSSQSEPVVPPRPSVPSIARSNTEVGAKEKHVGDDNKKSESKSSTLTQSLKGHASFMRTFSTAQASISKAPAQRASSPSLSQTKSTTNVLGSKRAFGLGGGGGGVGHFWPSTKSSSKTHPYACALYIDDDAAPDIVLAAKGTYIRSHRLPAQIISTSPDEPQLITRNKASPAKEGDALNLREAGLMDLREGEKLYVYGVYMEPRLLVKNVLGEYGLARLSEVKDAEIYLDQLKGEFMGFEEEPGVP